MPLALLVLLALPLGSPAHSDGREHVGLSATFEARGLDGRPTLAVRFMPLGDDIRVNAEPAPRLVLDPEQRVLDEASRAVAPPTRAPFPWGKYLDPAATVAFPVDLGRGVPAGRHRVTGKVTYFYCSLSQGWCRRAQEEIQVQVDVR